MPDVWYISGKVFLKALLCVGIYIRKEKKARFSLAFDTRIVSPTSRRPPSLRYPPPTNPNRRRAFLGLCSFFLSCSH